MRASPAPPGVRRPGLRRVALPAVAAVAVALATVPAAGAAGLVPPSLDPSTDNATTHVDPDLVVPTDTVVEAPEPGFVAPPYYGPQGLGQNRVDGPNVLWGSLLWQHTATGPASGVRVTMLRQQDGWRFSTTTDEKGRFRVAVPDGTYALTAADARLPRGTWTPPQATDGRLASGLETWNGGRGTGLAGVGVTPRPLRSCTTADGTVVDGTDADDPGGTVPRCPFPAAGDGLEGVDAVLHWGTWFGTYPETGRDGAVLSYMVPPAGTPTWPPAWSPPRAAPSTTPTAVRLGVPRLPRTIRLSSRRGGTFAVRCPAATTCAGTVRLSTVAATTRSRSAKPVVLASARIAAGRRTAALRLTARGRRTVARRTTTTTVTWQPVGGTPTTVGPVRLRVGGR